MRIYKLYAAGTTAAAAASITFIKSGRIRFVNWDCILDGAADNDYVTCEVSLHPVSGIGQNDTRGSIDQVTVRHNLATNGAINSVNNKSAPVDVPVGFGEKAYLNHAAGGGGTGFYTCYLHVEE